MVFNGVLGQAQSVQTTHRLVPSGPVEHHIIDVVAPYRRREGGGSQGAVQDGRERGRGREEMRRMEFKRARERERGGREERGRNIQTGQNNIKSFHVQIPKYVWLFNLF